MQCVDAVNYRERKATDDVEVHELRAQLSPTPCETGQPKACEARGRRHAAPRIHALVWLHLGHIVTQLCNRAEGSTA